VAVLKAIVPVLFAPMALTDKPFAGLTVTVMGVFKGRFEHCTTTGTGLFCCAEITASGVVKSPVGVALTTTPPIL
jgi:hypothetical protein